MRTIILLISFILGFISVNAEQAAANYNLSGVVCDKSKTPIEYASVSLWKDLDASAPQLITGIVSDESGNFTITGVEEGVYQLKVNYVGFGAYIQQVEIASSINLDPIYLEESNTLSQVTVSAYKPIVKSEKGILTLDVANSDLKNLPTIMDVLAFAPSVEVIGNSVSVLGRAGNPQIFINNKEVRQMSEVELLQPADIESISVNRNPSARYEADLRSVIYIKTRKRSNNSWSSQVYHSSVLNSRYNHAQGVNINANTGKFDNYLMYKYSDKRNKEENESFQDVNFGDIQQLSTSVGTMKDVNRDHSLTIGTTYNINESNKLSIQYHTDIQRQDADIWGDEVIKSKEISNLSVFRFGESATDNHDVNLDYTLSIDSISQFTAFANYISDRNYTEQDIHTTDIDANSTSYDHLYSKTDFDIFIARAEYNRLLGDEYDFTAGLRYSGIRNKGQSLLQDITTQDRKIDDKSRLSDNVYATYMTLAKQFGELHAEAGLRFEYDRSDYKMNGEKMFDKNDYHLFPSLSLNYQVNSNVNLSLDMTSRITRVPFTDLDPTLNYISSIVYQRGNPNTDPHKEYNIEVGAQIKNNWALAASYTIHKDLIGQALIIDDQFPGMLIHTPINIKEASTLKLDLGYNNSWGWYMVKANGLFSYTDNKVPSLTGDIRMNNPMLQGAVSNIFNVKKKVRLILNFTYRNRYEYINTEYSPIYALSTAINFKMLQNRLDATIFGNDLLRKSDPRTNSQYGYVRSGQNVRLDSRMVGITLRYSFNAFKDKSKSNKESSEELNRIGQ
ncbi:outer membrane receptor protein involved in Fe transport [Dysgonomonas alginatilytica]|uniref:Outer membrane receptor protein involved in Fe transport n=1 Tax=Dysgonomonas alginatilytica TaxID=1605892 RepID=A0A2V3PK91_9BACT|nr:outer membrane beta-barrel family protein [Dysgonomonas alginatilytica]PXV59347.1 outer membrane receptor protein involved in Fe transport [Dysgonomonas alginatilytica]